MKRFIIIVICLTTVPLLMISCFKKEPIKIGFVSGLSGRHSEIGVFARNAVQLAIDEQNAAGGINGRPISLIIKDNKSDPEINVQAVNELVEEGVVAVIGPLLSELAESTIAATNNKNVLVISPTISTDELSDLDDQFIRVSSAVSNQAKHVAKVFLEDGMKSAAIVYDSSNLKYTEPIYQLFQDIFTKNGGNIAYVNPLRKGSKSNFLDIAQKIVKSSADSLLLITNGIDAAAVCQQVRKLDTKIKFYGVYWTKTGNIIERGGRAVEGMTIVASYESKIKSKRFLYFKYKYIKRYKLEPRVNSIPSYEAAGVLIYGLKHAKSLSGEALKQTILDKAVFEGLEEKLTFNKYGDVIRKETAMIIKNGQFIRKTE